MKYIYLSIFVFFLFSCTKQENSFRGKIKYVPIFKNEATLKGEIDTEIDTIAPLQIDFFSPYVITTVYKSKYFTKIYNTSTKEDLGYYCSKGIGPKEFLSLGILNQKQENPLWLQDYANKTVYNIDIAKTIKNKEPYIRKKFSFNEIEDPLQLFYISDSLLLIKSYEKSKGVIYRWYNPTLKLFLENEISLYTEILTQKDLNNVMTLADCLKPDGSKIASLTGTLNQIDILNLKDNSKNFSFTTNKRIITWNDIHEKKIEDYYISLPRCNNHTIFALFQNKKNNNRKEIHVINWEGEGLYKLHIKEDLRDFNINWNKEIIYGIDNNDIIYKYDISNLQLSDANNKCKTAI